MPRKDCVDRVLNIKYLPYKPIRNASSMACTYIAAKQLVIIRNETIQRDVGGDHAPRSLADAFGAVLAARQSTQTVGHFGITSDEFDQ